MGNGTYVQLDFHCFAVFHQLKWNTIHCGIARSVVFIRKAGVILQSQISFLISHLTLLCVTLSMCSHVLHILRRQHWESNKFRDVECCLCTAELVFNCSVLKTFEWTLECTFISFNVQKIYCIGLMNIVLLIASFIPRPAITMFHWTD